MLTVKDIYNVLDSVAPYCTAADFDNTGLSVGSFSQDVKSVLLVLDVTGEVISYAKENGFDLVISHHPIIFYPLKSLNEGSLAYSAVRSGISFLSSHTCLDKAAGGVNDCLISALSLKDVYTSSHDEFLKVGFTEGVLPEDFAKFIKKTLGGAVRFNNAGNFIKKVAVCSGAGADCLRAALFENADALVTGDASHHDFLDACEYGVSLFAAGHFETEYPVVFYLEKLLKERFGNELKVEIFKQSSPIVTLN